MSSPALRLDIGMGPAAQRRRPFFICLCRRSHHVTGNRQPGANPKDRDGSGRELRLSADVVQGKAETQVSFPSTKMCGLRNLRRMDQVHAHDYPKYTCPGSAPVVPICNAHVRVETTHAMAEHDAAEQGS